MTLSELVNYYCIESTLNRQSVYVNLKKLTISSYIRDICYAIFKDLNSEQYDGFGSIEGVGSEVVIGCLAYQANNLRAGLIRKDYRITGTLEPGDRVILLENVTVSGTNLQLMTNVLRQYGCKVERAISVVQLSEYLEPQMKAIGIHHTYLVDRSELCLKRDG